MRKAVIGLVALLASMVLVGGALAAVVTVAPGDPSWHPTDQRGAGTVTWTTAPTARPPVSATRGRCSSRPPPARPTRPACTRQTRWPALRSADVTNLSYWTYQAPRTCPTATPLTAPDRDGTPAGGFTTLVYEPYWNGTVVAEPVAAVGRLRRSLLVVPRPCAATACSSPVRAARRSTRSPQVQPRARRQSSLGIGVNVGSNNPSYDIGVDGVQFNDTIYNFEIGTARRRQDDCKNGGWQTFNDPASRTRATA